MTLLVLVLALLLGRSAHAGVEATRLPGWSAWRWTAEDGLPLDTVTGLAFDRDGLAWVTTFDGLARFDGERFAVFRPVTHPGLPTARFTSVATHPDGRPWMLSETHDLVRWTPAGFQVVPTEALGIGPIDALMAGPDALWLRGDRGLARIDAGGTTATPWPQLAAGDRIRAAHPAADGMLVSAASGAVFRIDPATGAGTRLGQGRLVRELPSSVSWGRTRPDPIAGTPTGFASIHDHELWIDGPGEGRRALPLPGDDGLAFVAPSGAVHVRTTAGDFALEDGRLTPLAGGLGVPDATWWVWETRLYRGDALVLEGSLRLALLAQDARGGAWVAEAGRGLMHIRRAPVTSLQEDELGRLGPVNSVLFDRDGALWIAGADGLRRRRGGRTVRAVDPAGVPLRDAGSLLQTRDGTLHVTLPEGTCRVVSTAADPPVCGPSDLPRARSNFAVQLETRDGVRWGGAGDLARISPDGAITRFAEVDGWRPVRGLVELPDGTLLASRIGGGLFHVAGDTETRREGEPGSPVRSVRAMLVDDRGDVWLGTEGKGLCRLQLSGGRGLVDAPLQCLGPEQGLADPFVSALVSDGRGRLWMSSNRGLHGVRWQALLDTLEGRADRAPMVSLGRHEGMVAVETNGMKKPSVAVAPDGTLWFPTMDGVARLEPAAVGFPEPPPVVVERLSSPQQDWAAPPDTVTLGEDARELTVEWTAAAFDSPEALRFRYRLTGLDAAWRGPTTRRTATWTTLPPGTYTLELQSGWADAALGPEAAEGWGAPRTVAVVRVPPTFGETPAFWLLLAAVGAGLAGMLVWGRLRQARARQARLERAVDAATTELATRNHQLVAQSAALSAQRQALYEQAAALEERNARIARQAAVLAERNERVAAQSERLEQLDQVRTRFVANISHELRTPLTLIRGTLEDVSPNAPEALSRPLAMASRSAERLGELIEQLLDVARLDAGGVPLRARRGDLGRWVRRITARFEAAARTREVVLRVAVEDGVEAWFDPDLLERVLTNLLANGLDYCPAGGWLEVALRPVEDGAVGVAELAVTDTGPGVPEALRERLFERFFQADDSDRRARGGAGIGLALAGEIVALHGGEIHVTDAPGAGARFTVRLPLGAAHLGVDEVVLDPPEAPGPAADWAPVPHDVDAPVLLLVEDHPDMRAWMAEHLATAFQVAQAEDGAAALARLEAGLTPALVVSDVMMPNLDGLGLCRALRADPRWADLPVLLVTAKATEGGRAAGLEVAADYLTKPFRAADLLTRARRLARVAAPGPPPPAQSVTPDPSAFLEKLEAVALAHLDDTDFGAARLAKRFGLSQRQLQRRLREETGRTPAAWLRELRLQRAQELLRGGEVETVGEAAAQVGMSRSYLSRLYAQWAGRAASEDLQG